MENGIAYRLLRLEQRLASYEQLHAQNLRVYVSQLRRKLDPDSVRPQMITTEPGVGYRFVSDDT